MIFHSKGNIPNEGSSLWGDGREKLDYNISGREVEPVDAIEDRKCPQLEIDLTACSCEIGDKHFAKLRWLILMCDIPDYRLCFPEEFVRSLCYLVRTDGIILSQRMFVDGNANLYLMLATILCHVMLLVA